MSAEQIAESRKQVSLLAYVCAIAIAFVRFRRSLSAEQPDDILSRDSVLRDPDIPSLGNPNGDLTVVEYFDYQCPYCKKMAPELAQLVREDGNIRLVLKDWPIFGAISTAAAEIALAAKYQNKYAEAHDALIGADAKLTKASIAELLAKAGVDVDLAIDGPPSASKDDRRPVGPQRSVRPTRSASKALPASSSARSGCRASWK